MSDAVSRRLFLALASAGLCPQALRAQAHDPLAGRFGGAFSLVDHFGKRVSNASYHGKFALIYFGFTTCADTCPVDLPLIMGAIDRLGRRAERLQPLFITVDPRDTPAKMRAYIDAHFPGLIGLTGTEQELAAAARVFRVHRRKLTLPTNNAASHAHAGHAHADAAYTIDHGSLTYLLGPDGAFLTLFAHNTAIERMVEILGKYLPQV